MTIFRCEFICTDDLFGGKDCSWHHLFSPLSQSVNRLETSVLSPSLLHYHCSCIYARNNAPLPCNAMERYILSMPSASSSAYMWHGVNCFWKLKYIKHYLTENSKRKSPHPSKLIYKEISEHLLLFFSLWYQVWFQSVSVVLLIWCGFLVLSKNGWL